MSSLQSLKDPNLWTRYEVSEIPLNFWSKLSVPVVIDKRRQKLRGGRFHYDSATKTVVYYSRVNPYFTSSPAFIQCHDHEGRNHILVAGKPVPGPGRTDIPVLLVFRANYLRNAPRFATEGMGWYISELTVPGQDLNPVQKKNTIAIVLRNYQKMLENSVKMVSITAYKEGDDELLRHVRQSGRPLLLFSADNESSWSAPYLLTLNGGHTVEFDPFLPSVSRDYLGTRRRYYRDHNINAEVVIPLIYHNSGDGIDHNIGYIRVCITGEDRYQMSENLLAGLVNTRSAILASLRQANTIKYAIRANLSDASQDGLGIRMPDGDFVENLLSEPHFQAMLTYDRRREPLAVRLSRVYLKKSQEHTWRLGVRVNGIELPGSDNEDKGLFLFRRALHTLRENNLEI